MRRPRQGIPQQGRFTPQADVLVCQATVYLAQAQISHRAVIQPVHARYHRVGRRKPHAALIAVVAQQQQQAHPLEHDEEQQIGIFAQEIQQIVHLSL